MRQSTPLTLSMEHAGKEIGRCIREARRTVVGRPSDKTVKGLSGLLFGTSPLTLAPSWTNQRSSGRTHRMILLGPSIDDDDEGVQMTTEMEGVAEEAFKVEEVRMALEEIILKIGQVVCTVSTCTCIPCPKGDAGLTGRMIVIDTDGGWGAHGESTSARMILTMARVVMSVRTPCLRHTRWAHVGTEDQDIKFRSMGSVRVAGRIFSLRISLRK